MAAWRAITVSDQDGLTSVCSVPAPRAQAAWAHRLDQRGMTQARAGDDGRVVTPGPLAASVLADRMAAALLHHEPGWRLPRHTALARRYNVTVAEIDTAIDLLVQRHLLTRLPDGQVFRASPAEYRLALEGLPGFATSVDPMGGQLACKSRHVARRRAAEEVARALGAPPGQELLDRPLPVDGRRRARGLLGQLPAAGNGRAGQRAGGRGLARRVRARGTAARVPSRSTSRRPCRRWPAACGCPRVRRPSRSPSGWKTPRGPG